MNDRKQFPTEFTNEIPHQPIEVRIFLHERWRARTDREELWKDLPACDTCLCIGNLSCGHSPLDAMRMCSYNPDTGQCACCDAYDALSPEEKHDAFNKANPTQDSLFG